MNENKKVLLVDDNFSTRNSYELILKIKGYDVVSVSSVEEALIYKNEGFDIAILDGLEGKCFGLIDEISANRPLIITGDEGIFNEAKRKNIESYPRPLSRENRNKIFGDNE